MARRPRRGDGVVSYGLLWAFACAFLVAVCFFPRQPTAVEPSVALKSHVYDEREFISNADIGGRATMSLVESLPVGDFELSSTVLQTFEVLMRHVEAATTSVDLSAMYWNLLGKEDRKTYSALEMSKFGADRGKQLLFALRDAARRGVRIRIVTAPQQVKGTELLPSEVQLLVDAAPEYVVARCWNGSEWYGSGILHQKIWIFDSRHIYVGSANMDWKSLAQVMEVGVVMENVASTSPVIRDIQNLFETWWMFASSELLLAKTASYFSDTFQHDLQVPVWSLYLPEEKRSEDPFRKAGILALGNISHQLQTQFSNPDGVSTTAHLFVAAAPLEVTAGRSRAFDEDALVYTIRSARSFVSLSVMDFAPFSMYTPGSLHWPVLNDALLAGIYGKSKLRVRLLISQWQHTDPQVLQALATLQKQAALCQYTRARCSGRLEIKIFQVPGWQNTTSSLGRKALWPSYTRVNHAKFIVTDARANIGTSNMEWGYFYTTAGASVNTDHESTRKALENVFERNWNSTYARPLHMP
ncbi:unnamed protein product [Hyaloperonospora brassicae]|uniref:PLD phosphodiesterase domain-containing protein n=1 Tax=Hyaloperonospora brassicae TaxID=162125 RepID=A0AAV0TJS4_HYABA|nr:unnamed protein product [Hyaloperonospora brassicae]